MATTNDLYCVVIRGYFNGLAKYRSSGMSKGTAYERAYNYNRFADNAVNHILEAHVEPLKDCKPIPVQSF